MMFGVFFHPCRCEKTPQTSQRKVTVIIRFERTGGFAAIPQRVVIDTDMMGADQRRSLMALIEPASFFHLPKHIPSADHVADRFQYRITIEDVERTHTIQTDESDVPDTLKPLIEHLTALARSKSIG
jgi:hypothetical protein